MSNYGITAIKIARENNAGKDRSKSRRRKGRKKNGTIQRAKSDRTV